MQKDFGLIGKNISYSFSVGYFKDKFEKEDLKEYTYQNFDLQNITEITSVLKQNPNLKGLNVTIPYKESVLPFLDKIDKKALKIGAVNCIKFTKDNKLKGYNVDWIGFYKTLEPFVKNHKKALVFGNGGASKAVVFALKKLKIKCKIVSRNPKDNNITYEDLNKKIVSKHTILINTTPLGTFPNINECIDIPFQYVTKEHLAYDLIYNPEKTQFLKNCEQNGAKIINGYNMLVEQAEASFTIWSK